jgi:hypothetical protein
MFSMFVKLAPLRSFPDYGAAKRQAEKDLEIMMVA